MSIITILASWYRVVLGCFGGRAGCCVELGIFQACPSLGSSKRMVIPLRICCCVSIPLWCNPNMPCESTVQNLRSCNNFRMLIPFNTWFLYNLRESWVCILFLHPYCLRILGQGRRNRRGTQKAFEYCPPRWMRQSAHGVSNQAVSCTSFPSAFGNFNAPVVFALILLHIDEFWKLVVLLHLMPCLLGQFITTVC